AQMESVGLLDFTSSAFYPNLSDASVRKLCKAREYANDVKRYYHEQACHDDNLLSTMSEILMDLVDALLASKPFHSHSLSDVLTKGFSSALVKQTPWLLRFAHSFLLVMSELEQRQLTVSEAITEKLTQAPIVNAQPISITPLMVPSAIVTPDAQIKMEEEEGPSIEQNRLLAAPLVDVKEEPTELEDEFEELSNIASTSSSYPAELEQRGSSKAREPRRGAKKGDEELIVMYSIPFSRNELIEMPRRDFTRLQLTVEQLSIAKKIRRKGLKRLSAKRCAEIPWDKRKQRKDSPDITYVYDQGDDSD
ncbi:hypothetical protein PENTCL1PPCAC_4796, partial [Pristionchus entomophagus]